MTDTAQHSTENNNSGQWKLRWVNAVSLAEGEQKHAFLRNIFSLTEVDRFRLAAKEFLFFPQNADNDAVFSGYEFQDLRKIKPDFAYDLGATYYKLLTDKLADKKIDQLGFAENHIMSRYSGAMRYGKDVTAKVRAQSMIITALEHVGQYMNPMNEELWAEKTVAEKSAYLAHLGRGADHGMVRLKFATTDSIAPTKEYPVAEEKLAGLSHERAIRKLQEAKAHDLIEAEMALLAQNDPAHPDYQLFSLQQNINTFFMENTESTKNIVHELDPKKRLAKSYAIYEPAYKATLTRRDDELMTVLSTMGYDVPTEFSYMEQALDMAADDVHKMRQEQIKDLAQKKPWLFSIS